MSFSDLKYETVGTLAAKLEALNADALTNFDFKTVRYKQVNYSEDGTTGTSSGFVGVEEPWNVIVFKEGQGLVRDVLAYLKLHLPKARDFLVSFELGGYIKAIEAVPPTVSMREFLTFSTYDFTWWSNCHLRQLHVKTKKVEEFNSKVEMIRDVASGDLNFFAQGVAKLAEKYPDLTVYLVFSRGLHQF